MPEPPRTLNPLPLVGVDNGRVVIGCEHNLDPNVRIALVPDEDPMVTAARALNAAVCQLLGHSGRDERPLEADGTQRWYIFRNDLQRLCTWEGCTELHPYLMAEHMPYADTQPVSPIPGCTPVNPEPGMTVVYREIKEGLQENGWRQDWVYRELLIPGAQP